MLTVTEKIKGLLKNKQEVLVQADDSTNNKENGMCYDGIVNETCFNKQPKKVIFLLKETNGNDDKGQEPESYNEWDYRSWLQHQQANNEPGDDKNSQKFYYKTFNNVCMWLDVFYDTLAGKQISYDQYMESKRFNTDTLRKNLSKTAIVNLKKTWGGASTDCKKLTSYLQSEEVREVLREEIKLINPDVVLCGGADGSVFECANMIFGGEVQKISVNDDHSVKYFCTDNTVFLQFYHPSARKQRKYLYDYSTAVFNALHTMQK